MEIIGPADYARLQGADGQSPQAQSNIASGTNWSGVRGGPSGQIDQAPGGQFSEQANMNAQAFNTLMSFAGKEFKRKTDEAAVKAYYEGVKAAAMGKTIEQLHEEKVKTGIWDKLVPDRYHNQGFHDFNSYTTLNNEVNKLMLDMPRLAEMDPEAAIGEFYKRIDAQKTGVSEFDSRMDQLATPLFSSYVTEVGKAHAEYLMNRTIASHTNATISAMDVAKKIIGNSNPSNAAEQQLLAYQTITESMQKAEHESDAMYQQRFAVTTKAASEQGNAAYFTAMEAGGMLEYMSPENQVAFLGAKDSANAKSKTDFLNDNAMATAQLRIAMDSSQTVEKRMEAMAELNAMYQLKTGSSEDLMPAHDVVYGGLANIKESESQLQKVRSDNAWNTYIDAQNTMIETALAAGNKEEAVKLIEQGRAAADAAGRAYNGKTLEHAITNETDEEKELRAEQRRMVKEQAETQEKNIASAKRQKTARDNIQVSLQKGGENLNISPFLVPPKWDEATNGLIDQEQMTDSEVFEVIDSFAWQMDEKGNKLGMDRAVFIARVASDPAYAGPYRDKILKREFSQLQTRLTSDFDPVKVMTVMGYMNNLKAAGSVYNAANGDYAIEEMGPIARVLTNFQSRITSAPSAQLDPNRIWREEYQKVMYTGDLPKVSDADRNLSNMTLEQKEWDTLQQPSSEKANFYLQQRLAKYRYAIGEENLDSTKLKAQAEMVAKDIVKVPDLDVLLVPDLDDNSRSFAEIHSLGKGRVGAYNPEHFAEAFGSVIKRLVPIDQRQNFSYEQIDGGFRLFIMDPDTMELRDIMFTDQELADEAVQVTNYHMGITKVRPGTGQMSPELREWNNTNIMFNTR